MIIRTARPEDDIALRRLWMEAFCDEEAYVNFFMQHKRDRARTPILAEGEEVLGMIHLLPCTVLPQRPAFYWYAVAIRKDARGRGLFRFLLTAVLEKTKAAGYANLCVPAAGLAPVYQKYGFPYEYRAADERLVSDGAPSSKVEITVATPADFLAIPQRDGDVSWSEEAVAYALSENALCGGKNLLLTLDGVRHPAMLRKTEEGFRLDETTLRRADAERVKNSLLHYLGEGELILRDYERDDAVVALSDTPIPSRNARISFTMP